jgi:cytochrome c553
MFAHFALARDLRAFAVNGDLERLRIVAEELATTEPTWGMPPGSDAFRAEVHAAARAAAVAEDPPTASQAVARVAAQCGACHLANDGTLGQRFQVAAPLLDDPATRHANYLSWTSRLLWDGLVGPSEAMWRTGAGALAAGEGVPTPRVTFIPPTEIARAGEVLRALGVEAVTAVEPEARIRILGEIWTTCADCHLQAGVR